MDDIVDALQGIVMTEPEPETETQPDPTQADDTTLETQITEEITALWSTHLCLSLNRRTANTELRQIRAKLAERLYAIKQLLCRVGRSGQWRSWLKERKIPRSSADRLCERHAETLGISNQDASDGAIPDPAMMTVEKLAKVVWSRFRKVLVSDEVVIDFIGRLAELSGFHHEQRVEGLVIFKSVSTAEEVTSSAPASSPVQQPSEEAPVITDVPNDVTAATPTETGLAVEAADASNGVAA